MRRRYEEKGRKRKRVEKSGRENQSGKERGTKCNNLLINCWEISGTSQQSLCATLIKSSVTKKIKGLKEDQT